MAQIRTFKDLLVWQRSKELAKAIYQVMAVMPATERFGLTNHMRRAAISIPSNIAEGYARQSTADYLRFLRNARGSLAEQSTQYELATEMELVQADQGILALLAEVDRMLQSLIMKIQQKVQEEPQRLESKRGSRSR
jgi:four helix bundle protein